MVPGQLHTFCANKTAVTQRKSAKNTMAKEVNGGMITVTINISKINLFVSMSDESTIFNTPAIMGRRKMQPMTLPQHDGKSERYSR